MFKGTARHMGLRFVPLLFVTVLCTQGYASLLTKSAKSLTAPAFVWSDDHVLQQDGNKTSSKVIYQDFDATALVESLWSTLTRSPAAGQNQQQASPDALVIFVGNQVRLADLSSRKEQPALQSLQKRIHTAGSAVSIPALSSQGSGVAQELIAAAKKKNPALHAAATCLDPTAELEKPAQLLQTGQQGSGPKAVLVCAPAGADWTLETEMAYLESLSGSTAAACQHNIMAYISDPALQVQAVASTSRSLLQSMELPSEISGLQLPSYAASLSVPATYLCDDKCFTQVRVIEVFILFVTLLTALLSGICMMNVLGTPTKFETAKDARQSHE